MRHHSGGPAMAHAVMVSGSPGTASRPPLSTTTPAGPPTTTTQRSDPWKSGGAQPTRLSLIRASLSQSGFSQAVSDRIIKAHRPGTRSCYDAQWHCFASWCGERGLDPVKTTTPILSEFLNYLFTVKDLRPATISGYRSAITTTLNELGGESLGHDPHISKMLQWCL